MLENLLTTYHWLQLSNEERMLIKKIFKIRRSGGTVVEDNKVKSDGHTVDDLRAVNIESMQEFLDSKNENFDALWHGVIETIRDMIIEEEEKRKQEIKKQQSEERKGALMNVVESIVDSIKKLEPDMQLEVKKEVDGLVASFLVVTKPTHETKRTKKAK